MTKVRPMVAWSTGAVTVLIGLNELGLEAGVLDFRYEFSDDWSIATFLRFPRGASAAGPCACFYAVGLNFVAGGSCCPFGQSDYRTPVSRSPRLRKNVSPGGSRLVRSSPTHQSDSCSARDRPSHSSISAAWLVLCRSSACDWR